MHNVLLFSEIRSYMTIALEEQLKEHDYNVISVEPDLNAINAVKEPLACILIYAESDLLKRQQALVFLRDKSVQDDVPVFVIGDINELAELRNLIPKKLLQQEFQRPIDVKEVVSQMHEYISFYGTHHKKKILVVDDSGAMLRSVKSWLEGKYQVILANSGTMAIKYLSTNRPDLVLLDYEMPICDGKQTLEMIRSEREFADIPVIFLTGKQDRESIMQVMGLGPAGYLLKTMKPEEVKKYVDRFFAKKRAEQRMS
jgi:CheY-like chemotaxis protein